MDFCKKELPETASDLPLQAAQVYAAAEEGVNEGRFQGRAIRRYFVEHTKLQVEAFASRKADTVRRD
jgi:hypothetical protein